MCEPAKAQRRWPTPDIPLAVYALPFMLGVEAARWAYASGSGLIGAGLVGLVASTAAYGLLLILFMVVRPPIPRPAVALVFAGPAVVAGYALVHGVTREAIPSEVWRVAFCLIGGSVTGLSALARILATVRSIDQSA
ncbi:hypothetical protein V5F34_10440 [Xanthobacter autotrophicus]|uniref:Uncharacterized protein n=1 Tax=Xanthobacter flavus TaxID=281 RepID=A0A9W6CUX0_XANFL|nr:hypothetical protein [Xanthobacter flavus]MDR6336945.1 hypothetical protein [Xanthobacter flavus]GLI25717.1 hypothetical protein XFLAVUS301_53910 [Xanthobacter flavus]